MLQVPMPKTDAERSREYRQRKKENDNKNKIKKPPKSSTERVRDFRARRIKILDKQNENNSYNVNNNVAGEPNSDKGRLFLHVMHENGSDYDNTEAGQALTKNLIEVKLPSRNDDGEGLLIPRVKHENDSDFVDYTEAGQAFTPNIIEVKLPSRIDDGAGLIIPRVKQDNDSDFDDYTGDKGTLSPHAKSPQENDSDYDNTDDAGLLIPVVKLEYESDGDDNTGNDTDCVYGSGAPGPSTEKELRADIVDNECWTTYSRQDFKPSETESTDNESRRLNKAPKTAAERGREYRARKALLRQQRKQQQEQDNQAIPPEIKKLEKRKRSAEATRRWREKKRALSGLSKKQAKTAAERMREYRQRKKRERKGGQDLDAIVSVISSHVNQVAGPSTVNSTSAELQQQNSHLCTVCNRLWYKDDLSKEVTNINNINGAVICPTCKVALDEQRPVDERLDDAGLLIPIVKLEYESDGDDNTGNDTDSVYGSGAPGPSTEEELRADIVDNECWTTYSRQDFKPSETESTDNESRRLKKAPKTAAERARDYRARKARLKEQLKQQQERDATSGQSEDNQVPKPPEIRITDKGAISDSSEKQVETPAEPMREYRPRIKSADNIRRLNLAQRQRIHRMRRKDNENIDKIFKMKKELKEYLHKLKCSRLNAILIQNEGNVSQIEGESGQDLDAMVSTSSQVNQVAGPSTVNSTSAELQQQNSHLCTVCNRLWRKDDLSKEVTNINNINGAVICPTCKVALDEQRPADEQLDDAGLLIPIVKLEYESDGDDNTGNDTDSVYRSGAPGPSTEKELRTDIVDNECWTTYSRQDFKPSETESTDNESRRLKKAPKTAAERARDYRARKARLKEQLKQQQERDATDGQSEDNQVPKPPEIRITDKGAISDSSEKQVETPAEPMREYRPIIKSADNIRRLNHAQRQRNHRMRRKDNENIDKIFKMKEELKEYLHKLKCSRFSAILIQNEGNVSQIEGESGQDLDAMVSTSSHVNQVAGPSTVNSTSAELQQQNSHLCTVCNRLWRKDDLSKEVTNINNINGAVICPTCKVAFDEQRPVDEQLEAGQAFTKHFIEVKGPSKNDDDAGLLIPVVKLEYESDGDDNTESQIKVVNEKEPDDHGPWTIEQSLSTNIEMASYSVENQANIKVFKLSNLPFQLEKDQLDCPVCHETFPNFVSLNTHMNVHYQNYYICDSCGKGFAKKTRLKSHLRTHRAGVFPCKFCDAVFDNMINKENHVSKEHKSGDVKCNICNMSLPSFFESQKHLVEVHNEMVKRYKCKACTKSFITPGHLSSHVRRDHLNERTTSVPNAT